MSDEQQKQERRTIEKLHLENFTAFKNLTMEFSPGINAIIGENATGKTHVLKVLYAVSSFDSEKEEESTDRLRLSGLIQQYFATTRLDQWNIINRGADPRRASIEITDSDGNVLGVRYDDIGRKGSLGYHTGAMTTMEFPTGAIEAVFIPSKEMLSHSKGFVASWKQYHLPFERQYYDILQRVATVAPKQIPESHWQLLSRIIDVIGGDVEEQNGTFYLVRDDFRLEMPLVAEGLRKFATLWLLVRNGQLKPGSILFWDEPDANMNPKLVGKAVEIMLMLQRMGVQIFFATHDYVVLKWLDLLAKPNDEVKYHALFRGDDGEIQCESHSDLLDIENNAILDTYSDLYNSEIERAARRIEGD